jgi:hypothetical protein
VHVVGLLVEAYAAVLRSTPLPHISVPCGLQLDESRNAMASLMETCSLTRRQATLSASIFPTGTPPTLCSRGICSWPSTPETPMRIREMSSAGRGVGGPCGGLLLNDQRVADRTLLQSIRVLLKSPGSRSMMIMMMMIDSLIDYCALMNKTAPCMPVKS